MLITISVPQAVDDNGLISHFEPAASDASSQLIEEASTPITLIPTGAFLLPAFCDLHLHAPQFLYQGNGLDLPLMQWLDKYTLQSEARLDANPTLARRVYTQLASQLIENGTGTVLLFGTIKVETNLILAECMLSAGIRAFIGKLSMDIDISSPDSRKLTYVERNASTALEAVTLFLEGCGSLVNQLPPTRRLIEPVLTPRFVPTCTNELLAGLGNLSEKRNLKIQSHLAESKEQAERVRSEREMDDINVFEKANLLTSRTIQAHCTFLQKPNFQHLTQKGTSIAHCPLSNSYFSEEPFPLREALDCEVQIGLGTDIAGGYSLDIMSAMRQAVMVSRMREGVRSMDASRSSDTKVSIDWVESLYLATRGGSRALGLEGIFKIGAPFDAQEVAIYDTYTNRGIGALNYFDLESRLEDERIVLDREMVEKWWCLGDGRNRRHVWIQGHPVKDT
ncbi:hypothetical protein CPB83DRAFT_862086 [Crepidotus variabilis]|uniref:Amidohydrolase-related domain-containing protein n=1 Tax=Crepidotus variabilis TaxID=179855 RepID=A0A9P6JKM3_9AGAR|nr:hypothetical protein CPB83DRAFT_862086 [Crepidotus variabilis]